MKSAKSLVSALIYFLCVVLAEIGFFYMASSIPFVAQYAMPLLVGIFLVMAWLLKLRIVAASVAIALIALYGVLSFYSDFPIYYLGYPEKIEDFLIVIAAKTALFAFPLIVYLAITKK